MQSSTPWPAAMLTSVLAFGFLSGPTAAQFQQYTPPGDLQGETASRREGLEADVANARWRWGSLRVQPELSLRNLAYVDDVFVGTAGEDVDDITASIAAGLHFYLPVGSKTTIAAYALPEYVWWQDQKDRRRFNDSFGLGVFSYFNRLSLELSGTSDERLSFVTSEIEQQVTDSTDALELGLEVILRRNLVLFASASSSEFRYLVEEAEQEDPRIARFDRLNRDEDILRAGLRGRLRGGWTLEVGVEESEASFLDEDNNLSNSGTSPYVGLSLVQGQWEIYGDVFFRSLEAEDGAEFQDFDETTGRVEVNLRLRPRLSLISSANRSLTYSIADGFTYALEDRITVGAEIELGRRSSLTAFTETGETDYTFGASEQPRLDDYTGWGTRLKIGLGRQAEVEIGYIDTEYDSNLPGFDRSITRITTSLRLSSFSWP